MEDGNTPLKEQNRALVIGFSRVKMFEGPPPKKELICFEASENALTKARLPLGPIGFHN